MTGEAAGVAGEGADEADLEARGSGHDRCADMAGVALAMVGVWPWRVRCRAGCRRRGGRAAQAGRALGGTWPVAGDEEGERDKGAAQGRLERKRRIRLASVVRQEEEG